ncbi:type VI secretion system protein TssA [Maridesulfovibrio sp. FT414]|uniref:type VI secretion system protein TssA n=1 Tax=Maridesulfovibrio sp. FT414 TaxID=2979469 RepID=UPI003D80172C
MELLDLGRKPVSDVSPSGDDARYEPEYDQLQQEIDKLASATAGGAVDWKHVVKLSSAILLNKSKDLKVASYLGVGLLQLKGIDGLSAGTQILLDLVTNFWDTLYPSKKRIRGRFGPVEWWIENAEKFLKSYDGPVLPKATVDLLDKRINDLDGALSEKSDEAPMLRDLSGYVQHLPMEEEKAPEPEAAAAEQAPSAAPPSAVSADASPASGPAYSMSAQAAVAVGNISNPDECAGGLRAGLASLAPVSEYLLANDLRDCNGYRLRRLAAWMPIAALPPAQNGQTMIPAPDGPVKDSIASQLKGGDYAGALRASESLVGEYLFWLDLSRMSAEALKGMGEGFSDALAGLETEVELYVKRLPGLAGMSFADGTPFADPKTRSWLQSIGRAKGGAAGDAGEKGDGTAEIMDRAAQLAADKKLFDAVSLVYDSVNRSPSVRARFRLQSGLTGLLSGEGQAGVALVHAECLLEHLDRYGLEEWEPELALSGLLAAYGAFVAEGGPDSGTRSAEILQRISRISPAEALKINGFN